MLTIIKPRELLNCRYWSVIIVDTDYSIAFSIQFCSSTEDYSNSKIPTQPTHLSRSGQLKQRHSENSTIWIDSSTGSFHNIFYLNPDIFYPIHSLFALAHVCMSSNYFSASPRPIMENSFHLLACCFPLPLTSWDFSSRTASPYPPKQKPFHPFLSE